MAGRQIEFPEKQTHNKNFEYAMIGLSIACIIFVILMIQLVEGNL